MPSADGGWNPVNPTLSGRGWPGSASLLVLEQNGLGPTCPGGEGEMEGGFVNISMSPSVSPRSSVSAMSMWGNRLRETTRLAHDPE